MKAFKKILVMLLMVLATATATAQPMSYYSMRNNARFLTDRMAYTLGLSASLIDDLYLINYDYISGVNDYLDDVALGYRYDDYMEVVYARDYALRRLLSERQWALLMTYDYFYRPISFLNHRWSFGIYAYDRHRTHFYYAMPRRFNDYRGGHFFGGMRPIGRVDRRPDVRPMNPNPRVDRFNNDIRRDIRPNSMNNRSNNPQINDRLNNNVRPNDTRNNERINNNVGLSGNNISRENRINIPSSSMSDNRSISSSNSRNISRSESTVSTRSIGTRSIGTSSRSMSSGRSMGGRNSGIRVGRR